MDDEHRSVAADKDVPRNTAQDDALEAGLTPGSNDDEVRARLLCDGDDLGRRIPSDHAGFCSSARVNQSFRRCPGNPQVFRLRLGNILGVCVENLRGHGRSDAGRPRSHDVGDAHDPDREPGEDRPASQDTSAAAAVSEPSVAKTTRSRVDRRATRTRHGAWSTTSARG